MMIDTENMNHYALNSKYNTKRVNQWILYTISSLVQILGTYKGRKNWFK